MKDLTWNQATKVAEQMEKTAAEGIDKGVGELCRVLLVDLEADMNTPRVIKAALLGARDNGAAQERNRLRVAMHTAVNGLEAMLDYLAQEDWQTRIEEIAIALRMAAERGE